MDKLIKTVNDCMKKGGYPPQTLKDKEGLRGWTHFPKNILYDCKANLAQDRFVLEIAKPTTKYYLEIGAFHPYRRNNTLILERNHGWKGLSVDVFEPPDWYKFRQNPVVNAVVSDQDGKEVELMGKGNSFGGIKQTLRSDQIEKFKHTKEKRKTTSIKTLLKSNKVPKKIGFCSLDVEGHELTILKAFPFHEYDVECWCIEHNDQPQKADIIKIMHDHGYVGVKAKWDLWFIKLKRLQDFK